MVSTYRYVGLFAGKPGHTPPGDPGYAALVDSLGDLIRRDLVNGDNLSVDVVRYACLEGFELTLADSQILDMRPDIVLEKSLVADWRFPIY